MAELIAFCGIDCSGCPIYTATREPDPEKQRTLRADVSRLINEHYHLETKPEDVTDCDGCVPDTGRLYSGCSTCEIRKCARQRTITSCARCPDYACDKLKKFFITDPEAERRLKRVRG